SLVDIGAVFGSLGDLTGDNQMYNGELNAFNFNNSIAGTYFQVVIDKTSLSWGYALFRMFPEGTVATSVATTITDNDTATWSLSGGGSVVEGASAGYTLALAGTLQAGETAKVDLALSFPANGPSSDGADAADFVNDFLTDVDSAIAAYNATPGVS